MCCVERDEGRERMVRLHSSQVTDAAYSINSSITTFILRKMNYKWNILYASLVCEMQDGTYLSYLSLFRPESLVGHPQIQIFHVDLILFTQHSIEQLGYVLNFSLSVNNN